MEAVAIPVKWPADKVLVETSGEINSLLGGQREK